MNSDMVFQGSDRRKFKEVSETKQLGISGGIGAFGNAGMIHNNQIQQAGADSKCSCIILYWRSA